MAEIVDDFRESTQRDPGSLGSLNLRIPSFSTWDWYAFLLPLASWASINVGGTLFGADFMLILGLPAVLTTNHKVLFYKPVRRVLILGALWLTSQIVTDLIVKSPPEDFARGWLKIIFTLAHFSVIWVLIHNSKRRCVLFLVGLAIASGLRSVTNKNAEYLADAWKFGWAFPVSIAVLLLVTFLMRKRYSVYQLLPLVLLTVFNMYENFRSQSLVLLLTIVVTHGYKSLRASGRTLSRRNLALLALSVVLASVIANFAYAYAASHSWLGKQAYIKFEEQGGTAEGVLLGGRSEILSSSAAVADSPWIGHGSWRRDPKYMWILVKRLREFGYDRGVYDQDVQMAAQLGTIPTHSHLMGAWVDAGILGAVFWVYILFLLIRFLATLNGGEPFLALVMFEVITLVWDILFSPYGAERRFTTTFFLALVLTIRYQKERQMTLAAENSKSNREPAFAIPT